MAKAPDPVAAGGPPRGFVSWFVRRAGLARCTTIAAVAGLALAAAAPGRTTLAIAGLVAALGGLLAGYALGRLMPGIRAALPVTLASVLLIGLMAGLLVGTVRISSMLAGDLPSRIGETVRAEVVVTGPVSANSGWQSATAKVVSLSADEDGRALGAGEKVLLEVAPPDETGDDASEASTRGRRSRRAPVSW